MAKTGVVAGVAAVLVVAGAGGVYLYAVHRGQNEIARAVAQIRQELGPNGSLDYATSSVHPLSRSATLDRVVFQRGDGTRVTADTLDLAPDGPNRFRSLHATNLVVTNAAGTLKASRVDAESVAYRPQGEAGAPVATTIDPAQLSWSSLRMENPDLSGANGRLTAATMRIDDYGLGRHSHLAMQTGTMIVSSAEAPGSAQLASLQASGFDLAAVVDALEHGRPAEQGNGAFDGEAETFTLSRGDKMVLSIDRVILKDTVSGTGPGHIDMQINGATSTPATAEGMAMLNAIGLNAVHWSMSLQGTSDPQTGKAQLSSWTVSARELGRLEIGMDFANLFPKQLQQNGSAPSGVFLQVLKTGQLAGLRVRLTDGGLLQRSFAARGKTVNMSADQMRQMAVATLQSPQIATMLPDAGLRDAVDKFVAHGGTLKVALAPQPPIPIAELSGYGQTYQQDPAAALKRLGVSATWSGSNAAP